MKRKIAVFTNGWNDDYLEFALEGIRKRASEDNIDVFIFLDYTSYDKSREEINGELNILNLPELENFDGVLLLGNTLNNAGKKEEVSGLARASQNIKLESLNHRKIRCR